MSHHSYEYRRGLRLAVFYVLIPLVHTSSTFRARQTRIHGRSNRMSAAPTSDDKSFASMKTARVEFALVAINHKVGGGQKLLAMGGSSTAGGPWRTTEMYSVKSNSWKYSANLTASTNGWQLGCAATVGDTVYAIGGENGGGQVDMKHMQLFDIKTEMWSAGPSLKWTREAFSCVAVGTKIYLLGGQPDAGGSTDLNGTAIYDTKAKTWSRGAQMKHARSDTGIAVFKGKIYVFGGFDAHINFPLGGFVNVTEAYDIATDTWTELASMEIAR